MKLLALLFKNRDSQLKKQQRTKWIPVLPRNYRNIVLYALDTLSTPRVFINKQLTTDYSTQGASTQRGIRQCRDFEVRDGDNQVLGFHDHPNEMWVSEAYEDIAVYCENQGWLKITGLAS